GRGRRGPGERDGLDRPAGGGARGGGGGVRRPPVRRDRPGELGVGPRLHRAVRERGGRPAGPGRTGRVAVRQVPGGRVDASARDGGEPRPVQDAPGHRVGPPRRPAQDPERRADRQGAADEDEDLQVFETVSDLLGRSLVAREQDDLAAIRGAWPDSDEAVQAEAALTLSDYLRLEPDPERLERFLMGWMEEGREVLKRGDGRTLVRMVDAAE